VQVLENEDQRLCLRECLEETAPGREALVPPVADPGLVALQPRQRSQVSRDPICVRGIRDSGLHRTTKLLVRLRGGVRLEDAGLRLDHLRQRPEGHTLAVGERTAAAPVHATEGTRLRGPEELVHEPALADPGHADERHELGCVLTDDPREGLAEERELLLTPYEGCSSDAFDAHACASADGLPYRDRHRLPLGLDRLGRGEFDDAFGCPVGRLVDQDRADRRGSLDARGGIDDVAGGHAFADLRASAESDQRLAGRDPDPNLEITLVLERVADRESGSDRPLGIVLVRGGRAEDRHDRVADELLDRSAEALELRTEACVVGLEEPAHVLGVHAFRPRREAHEVAEQNAYDLPLFASTLRLERCAAGRAEARVLRVLAPAAGADPHARRIGRARSRQKTL
jgi:hypothetical protein